MTELSYTWTHGAGGDAAYSPYSSLEFNKYMHLPALGGNATNAFVLPGYLGDLEVLSAGITQHSVTVNSGAALCNERLYILDEAVTVPIRQVTTPDYARMDAIVLRYTSADNWIRLGVLEGGEKSFLAGDPPLRPHALHWTTKIIEFALAYVIADYDHIFIRPNQVLDYRSFIYNAYARQNSQQPPVNLVLNSEWLGFSGMLVTDQCAPDGWEVIGTLNSSARTGGVDTNNFGSGRGQYNYVSDHVEDQGIGQWIPAGKSKTFTVKFAPKNSSFSGTEHCVVKLEAFRANGDESTVSKQEVVFDGWDDMIEKRFTVTYPEDDIEKLYLSITGDYGEVGQIMVCPGYHAGSFRSIHEVIPTNYALGDANWTLDAKSTGTTLIDLSADFGAVIPLHVRYVQLNIFARDSGSAGGAASVEIQGYAAPYDAIYGTLRLTGVPNSDFRSIQVIVPVNQIYYGTGVVGAQFRVNVTATGVGTLDATIQITGLIV